MFHVTTLDYEILEIGLKKNIPLRKIAAYLEFTRTSFDSIYPTTTF